MEEVKQNIEGYGKLVLPSLVDMEDLTPDTGAICQKARARLCIGETPVLPVLHLYECYTCLQSMQNADVHVHV